MSKFELDHELAAFRNDQENFKKELKNYQSKIAHDFQHDLGNDIKNVVYGNEVVKLGFWERLKYNIKFFLNKLFKTF